ncbi:MAG: NFACT RNA binding domain-containing protein [Myxococcota bacterium]|nr:NFACT RNA binding domain-containing protein [Myxococcota bacterium]
MHRALVGGQVQRLLVAQIAGREIALLQVRIQPPFPSLTIGLAELAGVKPGIDSPSGRLGENVHVLLVAGMGVATLDEGGRKQLRRAAQGATSPSQARWRALVGNGRVVALDQNALVVARNGQTWRALATDGDVEIALELSCEPLRQAEEPSRWVLTAHGTRFLSGLAQVTAGWRREALRRALDKARRRVARRIDAVRGDLERVVAAQARAELARLFVPAAAMAPRGATVLTAIDWSGGDERAVELPLDPERTAQEQIDALFKRARRLKEGAKIAGARLSAATNARAALEEIVDLLRDDPNAVLASLESRARAAAPRDFRLSGGEARGTRAATAARGVDASPRPYRVFLARSGARILVGRGAAHNDALTFHVARPHDMWLHTKHGRGAHVIVQLQKNGSCPADVLVEAAHLAAHFSVTRDESVVEVHYTPRRYLRKPRGSAAGLVVLSREKVLVLRREQDILARLLECELLSE